MKTLLLLLAFPLTSAAQLPNAPTPKFLTKEKIVGIAALTALDTIDAYTTTRYQDAGGQEQNPIARPFVKSHHATAMYFSASLGLAIGGTWLCHHEAIRHPRHKKAWQIAERVILWGNVAEEIYVVVPNLQGISKIR